MKKLYGFAFTALLLLTSSCKENTSLQTQTSNLNNQNLDLAQGPTYNETVTILQALDRDPNYNSLLKLANQAYFFEDIKNLEDVTFFAPTNAAINRLSEETYSSLRLPQNSDKLKTILSYHIVPGEIDIDTLISILKTKDTPYRMETLTGSYLSFMLEDNKIMITDEQANHSYISEGNIDAFNGVIHGIDNVLIPTNK